jgi:squalene synthase HpnC
VTLAEAYAVCLRLARSHYENFPVASSLLPAPMRPHIAAIYAFARTADDFADEGRLAGSERIRRIDDWESKLDAPDNHPVFVALNHTIAECRLDRQLFRDLLSAFRQDVTTTRYATWHDLLDYCRRSANPIGRLVLNVAKATNDRPTERRRWTDEQWSDVLAQSDSVCTALQLVNFWQDVAIDKAKGRDYLPKDLVTDFGDRARAEAGRRTRALFRDGQGVADDVTGRLRYELRATWLGGMRILEWLERHQFDTTRRPVLGPADFAAIGWKMLAWRTPDR